MRSLHFGIRNDTYVSRVELLSEYRNNFQNSLTVIPVLSFVKNLSVTFAKCRLHFYTLHSANLLNNIVLYHIFIQLSIVIFILFYPILYSRFLANHELRKGGE
jgi:hypothetical protein